MDPSTADQFFWIASSAGEIVLIFILITKRQYVAFPFFLAWLVSLVLSFGPLYWIAKRDATYHIYERAYVIESAIDYMLQLGVLLEIGNAVLRPSRKSFSRRTTAILLGVATLSVFILVSWTFHSISHGTASNAISDRILQANFFFAYLRLVTFALIAACSQMLGITWKNHVMRLAGGLAFYSAVSVVVELSISHLSHSNYDAYLSTYYLLNHVESTSFILALGFWIWSFVQKDAPRKEFTPQMQHFLVSISETAKRSRLGFTRSLGHK